MQPTSSSTSFIEKLQILANIARNLHELHMCGISHGDIKPENILFSSSTSPYHVRLADFGSSQLRPNYRDILCLRVGESDIEMTKRISGTPRYSAPEMLENPFNPGYVCRASRSSDMYSFAIITWETFTLQKPFKDINTMVGLSSAVHRNERPDVNLIPDSLPKPIREAIIDMITRCWSVNRKDRLSAMTCLQIINNALASQPTATTCLTVQHVTMSTSMSMSMSISM